jgi:hypothetical protein
MAGDMLPVAGSPDPQREPSGESPNQPQQVPPPAGPWPVVGAWPPQPVWPQQGPWPATGYAPQPGPWPTPYAWGYSKPPRPPVLGPTYVPGPIFDAMLVIVLFVGLAASSQPSLGFLAAIMVFAALNIGVVWLIAFIIAANDTRLKISRVAWARWAGPPVAFFLAVTLMMSGLPGTVRFEYSRPALEQAATNAQAGAHYGDGWIGLTLVHDVRVNGAVTLFLMDSDWSGGCTLAYSPADNADLDTWRSNSWQVTDYGHGWWYGCAGYASD